MSQGNFFDKEEMKIKKIIINGANFSLLRSDLKPLNKFKRKKFSNKKIKINNSNIFFKDNLGEIISIIKIDKMILFFDDEKLSNFINLKGEVFNESFIFELNNRNDSKKYEEINFNSKLLRLNIYNKSFKEKEMISGKNSISFLNSTINTKYNFKEKLIIFKSDNSRLNNSQVNYSGELSVNPFNFDLNINLNNHKISKLFSFNPILIELIKSGLLFNDNISVDTSVYIDSNINNEIFQNAKINFNIVNGKIDFNKTRFVNDDVGSLQFNNSNLFLKNNELVFNSNLLIDIKNSEHIFSFLNTAKSSRKNFKNILINFDYDFLKKKIKFNSVKIDNIDVDTQFLRIIDGFNDNALNNLNKSRRLLNDLLKAYDG